MPTFFLINLIPLLISLVFQSFFSKFELNFIICITIFETRLTPMMMMLRSRSRLVRLNIVFPLFCISFVSLPAKITIPQHHRVLRSTHPLYRTLSLSRGQVSPSHRKVPSNLLRLLLGGSHIMSPTKRKQYILILNLNLTNTTRVKNPLMSQ